jgi:hypothetical protein
MDIKKKLKFLGVTPSPRVLEQLEGKEIIIKQVGRRVWVVIQEDGKPLSYWHKKINKKNF